MQKVYGVFVCGNNPVANSSTKFEYSSKFLRLTHSAQDSLHHEITKGDELKKWKAQFPGHELHLLASNNGDDDGICASYQSTSNGNINFMVVVRELTLDQARGAFITSSPLITNKTLGALCDSFFK